MGGEQSSPGSASASGQLKSQRDEDIPYTSYSISKPIDEAPKSSPKLKTSKAHQPKGSPKEKDSAIESKVKHDIVVVAQGTAKEDDDDPELTKLQNLPVFLPVMRGSLNIPNVKDPDVLDKLDQKQVLMLCLRYQEHLKQCSEAVSFDQNALCVRIKEIDFAIHAIMDMVTERQKRYAKYAEQVQKVQEMSSVLKKVKMSIDSTVYLLDQLNNALPPEEQLEPFTFSSTSCIN